MEVVDILGWIALIITLIYTGLGLPAQIRKNLISSPFVTYYLKIK